mmetsp:Transcript_25531/g.39248  ORF Transcript_25531/g.39248 Transcript_25531/m.39248 type:complete len:104 (-) Transcript_25531:119-430(-)
MPYIVVLLVMVLMLAVNGDGVDRGAAVLGPEEAEVCNDDAVMGCAVTGAAEEGGDDVAAACCVGVDDCVCKRTLIESNGCPTRVPVQPATYPATTLLNIDFAE